MIIIFKQQPIKWLALISLYFIQGLPHGFFGQAMPVILREQGVDLRHIGLLSLVALPWALKFLWAGWLDRWSPIASEPRRSWIYVCNLSVVFGLVILSFFEFEAIQEKTWIVIVIALLLINFLVASQDIMTDAMAVENLNKIERGIGNGIQVAGYRLGMIVAGGVLISLFTMLQWQLSLCLLAVLLFMGSLPLFYFQPRPPVKSGLSPLRQSFSFFKEAGMGWWLLLLVLYKWGDAFGTQMVRPQLVDLGYELATIGWLLGVVGFCAGLVGALLGGFLMTWSSSREAQDNSLRQHRLSFDRARVLILCLLFEAAALLFYALLQSTTWVDLWGLLPATVIAITGEHLAGGMATAALFTVMMDACRKAYSANDYAIQSCVVLVSGMMASALSGFSAFYVGYAGHYILASVACLLTIGMVIFVRERSTI